MKRSTGVALLLVLVMMTVHCGGSSRHNLVSITVSPASATAVSPKGTVQFTAIGNFNSAPTTQNIAVSWSSSAAGLIANINSNGLAMCIAPMAPITMSSPRRDRMSKLERREGDGKGDRPTLLNGWDSELSEFARDSPLEQAGFELSVPPCATSVFVATGEMS